MKKRGSLLLATLVAFGAISFAEASIQKGQKLYMKQCKKCHGSGTKGAAIKTQDEWEDLFANDAKSMKDAHDGTKGEKYINSKRFNKSKSHLRDFLYEYGSDSGNIPACG